MNKQGFLVISLDFELLWGVKDLDICEEYKRNVSGSRVAIPEILNLFESYGIHATWAVVGIMLNDSKEELLDNQPSEKPCYANALCSAYNHLDEVGQSENEDIYHYGGSLLKMIKDTPNQEIGSHTYSHYYCTEKGSDAKSFEADIVKSKEILRDKYGVEVRSIVFPRNQYTEKNLEIAKEHGFIAFRGNQPKGFDLEKTGISGFMQRVNRFADSFIPIYGSMTYEPEVQSGIANVRASRFFRPCSGLAMLEKAKIKRIKNQMLNAAIEGEMFHLWWHPHNFGVSTKEMLQELKDVLEFYAELNEKYDLRSITMGDYAEFCLSLREQ